MELSRGGLWEQLAPDPWLLLAAVALDGLLGDPVYRLHPIRLCGALLGWVEGGLRRIGADGYGGGILLSALLGGTAVGAVVWAAALLDGPWLWLFHLYILYSLVALKDLCRHGLAVDRAATAGDLEGARHAVSMLAGRDTRAMDAAACRRAALESLSENAVDGFVSPVFWYALLGLPGIVFFKVVSTLDSMVGNKTPRYLRFGWCGARLDDVLNYLPARLSYGLLAATALALPGFSALKALRVGWRQHALVPGPNSGWSEAAAAGALQRRLVGPIYQDGRLVTEIWLGDPGDPPGGGAGDIVRACWFVSLAGAAFTVLAMLWIAGGNTF